MMLSFHCLYCHGWEEKDSPSAGVLAEGDIGALMPALHFARQALRMSKEVTIYTNGNDALAKEITAAVEAAPVPMKTDAREITKLEKAPERSQITLHFKDGTNATEAFLAHKPKFRLRGDLAQQLGVELAPPGTIKVTPPFNQTSVRGVFAAGDCSSPMQIVTAALSSGSFVGAAAPAQLQAESCGQRPMF
jgi:thioredoxin reductase